MKGLWDANLQIWHMTFMDIFVRKVCDT